MPNNLTSLWEQEIQYYLKINQEHCSYVLHVFLQMKNKTNPEPARENKNIAADENGIHHVLRENTIHVNGQRAAPMSTNM